jgi:hypothetical protein
MTTCTFLAIQPAFCSLEELMFVRLDVNPSYRNKQTLLLHGIIIIWYAGDVITAILVYR